MIYTEASSKGFGQVVWNLWMKDVIVTHSLAELGTVGRCYFGQLTLPGSPPIGCLHLDPLISRLHQGTVPLWQILHPTKPKIQRERPRKKRASRYAWNSATKPVLGLPIRFSSESGFYSEFGTIRYNSDKGMAFGVWLRHAPCARLRRYLNIARSPVWAK
jgi:hypothetical protein